MSGLVGNHCHGCTTDVHPSKLLVKKQGHSSHIISVCVCVCVCVCAHVTVCICVCVCRWGWARGVGVDAPCLLSTDCRPLQTGGRDWGQPLPSTSALPGRTSHKKKVSYMCMYMDPSKSTPLFVTYKCTVELKKNILIVCVHACPHVKC